MSSTNQTEHYDIISLGSGEGGKVIAWFMGATQGKRCALIERRWLGGSCPNVSCLPSKNVVHSAKVHQLSSQGENFGLRQGHDKVAADMQMVKRRKDDMLDILKTMHENADKKGGVEMIWGDGRFTGPKTIEVTNAEGKERTLNADVIIVCSGSTAVIRDVPGLKEADPLTHIEFLDLDKLPSHLIIFGGGYIGLEFAQAMRRFGSKVTVIEHNKRILKREDDDVAERLQAILSAEGIEFATDTTISEVSGKSGSSVTIKGTKGGELFELSGSHILCATGRSPNNENIGLETTAIKTTNDGHIEVDEWNRTAEDGVFAVGDCSGLPYFTHVGFDDHRIVVEYLNGKHSSVPRRTSRLIPFTLFTDPELAHVGLRERDAKAKGIKYRFTKVQMTEFLRALTFGETQGFAKALISAEDDTILGFTALGPGVGELLPVVQLAMKCKLPYTDIAELIITHPTLSEGLLLLFSSVPVRD